MDIRNIKKISVFGPGIVGMPMAALLADSCRKGHFSEGAFVQVIQRNSHSSGWKVEMINKGKSPIGGIEPELEEMIAQCVRIGKLKASYHSEDAVNSDLIIVSVQTDKDGLKPNYEPLMEVMEQIADAVAKSDTPPVILSESTLAPTTVNTVLKPFFQERGLAEGKDLFLGISPNRVMPGRLVERIKNSDKIIGCINQEATHFVKKIYSTISLGTLHEVNAITAESTKTTENCYRDVMIAFATEVCRLCDQNNYDFLKVRALVNEVVGRSDSAGIERNIVPQGAILMPNIGVGGHCLPKDGILLSWRYNKESGAKADLIIKSRQINDSGPEYLYNMAARKLGGKIKGKVALLGASYLFNSDDTRNSPSLDLAMLLKKMGVDFKIHDPFVRANDSNVQRLGLIDYLSSDLEKVLANSEVIVIGVAHEIYYDILISKISPDLKLIVDGCHLTNSGNWKKCEAEIVGIGKGTLIPPDKFINFVIDAYNFIQWGFAYEVKLICNYYNDTFLQNETEFGKLNYKKVIELVNTCPAGRYMANPDRVPSTIPKYQEVRFDLLDISSMYLSV